MAKKPRPTTPKLRKTKTIFRGTETVPTHYANYLGLLATKGDVRLRFGRVVGDNGVDVLVDVYVSPDHLRDFIDVLFTKIHDYAAVFPASAWPCIATNARKERR